MLPRFYMAAIGGFFGLRIFYFCIIEMLDNQVLSIRVFLFFQVLDLVFLGSILWIFRAREWPQFFTMNFSDLHNSFISDVSCNRKLMKVGRSPPQEKGFPSWHGPNPQGQDHRERLERGVLA